MTHIFPNKQDANAATGELVGNLFRLPFKAKLCKYGVIPMGASVVKATTTTTFRLHTAGGTVLATFVPGSANLATQIGTGCAPETATNMEKGVVVCPGISEVASSGSIFHFMEYERVFE
jgi:hypothetical protein